MKRLTSQESEGIPWVDDPSGVKEGTGSDKSTSGSESSPFDYWRLCEDLTIVQAALLIAGKDPSAIANYVEGWAPESRPRAYEPAKQAIARALERGLVRGEVVHEFEQIDESEFRETNRVDAVQSFVVVDSLKDWLARRGFAAGFFFPEPMDKPNYLDRQHPRYAQKLAAAVTAWQALEDPNALSGKSPKQALQKWIREHASEFGLTDEDGKPYEQGVEDVAKVANRQLTGGAPKTPGS